MSHDDGHAEGQDAMSDEKFDHWLQSAARDYNRPADPLPAAPLAAMWEAIEGALETARPASAPAAAPAATVVPIARGRAMPRYWQAAAAVAILGIGAAAVAIASGAGFLNEGDLVKVAPAPTPAATAAPPASAPAVPAAKS